MVGLQVSRRWHPDLFDRCVKSRGFGLGAGVLGGFLTMLANPAGPVIQLYLTARNVPKMELIGIGARFFLLINLIKVPLNARLALITRTACGKRPLVARGGARDFRRTMADPACPAGCVRMDDRGLFHAGRLRLLFW